MASGRPDYFRGVDVTYQTLGEIINRPKYGAENYDEGSVQVPVSSVTNLLTVTGKGMTYGGVVLVGPGGTQQDGKVQLVVDGDLMSGMSFTFMNDYKVTRQDSYPIYLMKYDEVGGIYMVALSRGITFETSLVVRYVEAEGETPDIVYKITYALI